MPGEEGSANRDDGTERSSKATIVRLTGPDKWKDWHMSLMCSLMENDPDEELDKAQPDPAKQARRPHGPYVCTINPPDTQASPPRQVCFCSPQERDPKHS